MSGGDAYAPVAPRPARSNDRDGASGLSGWLRMAAAPALAIMALLAGLDASPMERLCSSASGAAMSGMVPMYLIMSAIHAPPWLELIRRRRGADRRA